MTGVRVFRLGTCGCGRCESDGWYWECFGADGTRLNGGIARSERWAWISGRDALSLGLKRRPAA